MDKRYTPNTQNDKLVLNKARSYNDSTNLSNIQNEVLKRKSLEESNDARSMDLALGRLKRSKLLGGEYNNIADNIVPGSGIKAPSDTFMTASRKMSPLRSHLSRSGTTVNDASIMSMNFSHYELMRNLSDISDANSESMYTDTTSVTFQDSDTKVRNERLEKFFRSAEMWSRTTCDHTVASTVPRNR